MAAKYPNKTPYHYCSNNPINRVDPTGMEDDPPKSSGGFNLSAASTNGTVNSDDTVTPSQPAPSGEVFYAQREFPDVIIIGTKSVQPKVAKPSHPIYTGPLKNINPKYEGEIKATQHNFGQHWRALSKDETYFKACPGGYILLKVTYDTADLIYMGLQVFNPFKDTSKHIGGDSYDRAGKDYREKFIQLGSQIVTWGAFRGAPVAVPEAAAGEQAASEVAASSAAEAGINSNKFNADELIEAIYKANKATNGEGKLISSTPESAINSASYYATVNEQGASIFKSIVKGHMFLDGNKRTGIAAIQEFAKQMGLNTTSEAELTRIALEVAEGKITDISIIAQQLFR